VEERLKVRGGAGAGAGAAEREKVEKRGGAEGICVEVREGAG
jgi:hypothetical protein